MGRMDFNSMVNPVQAGSTANVDKWIYGGLQGASTVLDMSAINRENELTNRELELQKDVAETQYLQDLVDINVGVNEALSQGIDYSKQIMEGRRSDVMTNPDSYNTVMGFFGQQFMQARRSARNAEFNKLATLGVIDHQMAVNDLKALNAKRDSLIKLGVNVAMISAGVPPML